jgi:hypothetical protein
LWIVAFIELIITQSDTDWQGSDPINFIAPEKFARLFDSGYDNAANSMFV